MSGPAAPSQLEAMGRRTFSFYPAILNIEHNEWRFRKATWSEVLVVNAKSDLEVWIPRRLIGQISQVDEPVMIVGLEKELEYKAGSVWPHERKILEMPVATGAPVNMPPTPAPAAPTRGSQPATEARLGRLIVTALIAGVAVCLLILLLTKIGPYRTVTFTSVDQDFLSLSRNDDYFSVVKKLGQPANDHWRERPGELQYRALWYPQRSYYVILFGADRATARYIGAMDRNWQVIHYVDLANGGSTDSMLRNLDKF